MKHEKLMIKTGHSTAELYTYVPDNSPEIDPDRRRPAVVVCPGGGYEFTSDREAEPVALRMNAMGFAAFVLRYSVKPAAFPAALQELAHAVALVREKADAWHVDPEKVVVMGFSAGGHLAASLGVYWHTRFLNEVTGLDAETVRPDGLVLCYPVVTAGDFAHRGSFKALLGEREEDLSHEVSLENLVTTKTPPTFLWHTGEDASVPVENSLLLADALRRHGVPFELHIFPEGVHGLSLATEETRSTYADTVLPDVAGWIDMAGRWIRKLN